MNFFLFQASLVTYGAAGLASRLAAGLALAAADFTGGNQSLLGNGFDMFHINLRKFFSIYYKPSPRKNQAYPRTRLHIFFYGGIMKAKTLRLKSLFDKETLKDIFRMSLVSIIITLAAVLIFGIIVKLVAVPDGIIMPINQVIKVLSLLFGAIIGIRYKNKGVPKGAIAGLIYTLISVFIFLILGGTISGAFGITDAVLGIVMGAVSGIIAVNTGKQRV